METEVEVEVEVEVAVPFWQRLEAFAHCPAPSMAWMLHVALSQLACHAGPGLQDPRLGADARFRKPDGKATEAQGWLLGEIWGASVPVEGAKASSGPACFQGKWWVDDTVAGLASATLGVVVATGANGRGGRNGECRQGLAAPRMSTSRSRNKSYLVRKD